MDKGLTSLAKVLKILLRNFIVLGLSQDWVFCFVKVKIVHTKKTTLNTESMKCRKQGLMVLGNCLSILRVWLAWLIDLEPWWNRALAASRDTQRQKLRELPQGLVPSPTHWHLEVVWLALGLRSAWCQKPCFVYSSREECGVVRLENRQSTFCKVDPAESLVIRHFILEFNKNKSCMTSSGRQRALWNGQLAAKSQGFLVCFRTFLEEFKRTWPLYQKAGPEQSEAPQPLLSLKCMFCPQ